jgi:Uma2 family endonuclease
MRSVELEGVDPESIRPLRRSEYDRLVAMGAFADERLELLEGTIVAMSPHGTAHAYCVRRLTGLLVRALGDRAVVQVQGLFAASDECEPETWRCWSREIISTITPARPIGSSRWPTRPAARSSRTGTIQ